MSDSDLIAKANAERDIGRIAADLAQRLDRGEVTAREMILACRQILGLWVGSGGDATDDDMIGIMGIESQCDHVMLPPGERKPRFPEYDDEEAEIESLGAFFREAFTREVRALADRFGQTTQV